MYYAGHAVELSLTPYVFVLIAIMAVSVVSLVALILRDHGVRTRLLRWGQRRQLSGMRMHRMLELRGVNVESYLDAASPADIRRQIRRCRECPTTALCDTALRACARESARYSFCPNVRAVDRHLAAVLRPT